MRVDCENFYEAQQALLEILLTHSAGYVYEASYDKYIVSSTPLDTVPEGYKLTIRASH